MGQLLDAAANIRILSPKSDLIAQLPVEQWPHVIDNFIKESAVTSFGNDEVKVYLQEMLALEGCCASRAQMENLQRMVESDAECFKHVFASSGMKPTNFQLAMAVFIVANLKGLPQQVWKIPSGGGKSFVIAVVGLIALLKSDFEVVHFVLPSAILMQREKADFSGYWRTVDAGCYRTHYHESLNFVPGPKDLVLVDEADVPLYTSGPDAFFRFAEKPAAMICFTATTGAEGASCLENAVFSSKSMRLFKHWPKSFPAAVPPQIEGTLPGRTNEEVCASLLRESRKWPVLVFCDKDLEQAMQAQNVAYLNIDNYQPDDCALLRRLSEPFRPGFYHLLVATDAAVMRGTDFRAQHVGMLLVIGKTFDNAREVAQGLGRCGRWGERCKRLKTSTMGEQLFDQEKENHQQAMLFKFMHRMDSAPKLDLFSQADDKKQKQASNGRQKAVDHS